MKRPCAASCFPYLFTSISIAQERRETQWPNLNGGGFFIFLRFDQKNECSTEKINRVCGIRAERNGANCVSYDVYRHKYIDFFWISSNNASFSSSSSYVCHAPTAKTISYARYSNTLFFFNDNSISERKSERTTVVLAPGKSYYSNAFHKKTSIVFGSRVHVKEVFFFYSHSPDKAFSDKNTSRL